MKAKGRLKIIGLLTFILSLSLPIQAEQQGRIEKHGQDNHGQEGDKGEHGQAGDHKQHGQAGSQEHSGSRGDQGKINEHSDANSKHSDNKLRKNAERRGGVRF